MPTKLLRNTEPHHSSLPHRVPHSCLTGTWGWEDSLSTARTRLTERERSHKHRGAPKARAPPEPAAALLVTCAQRAVRPVEVEHRVAAQPAQRLLRRGPDMVKVALLAVVVEQGLRERRTRFAHANAPAPFGATRRAPPLPSAPPPPQRLPAPSTVARTCCTAASIASAVASQRHQSEAAGRGGEEPSGTLPLAVWQERALPLAPRERRRERHRKENCKRRNESDAQGRGAGTTSREAGFERALVGGL